MSGFEKYVGAKFLYTSCHFVAGGARDQMSLLQFGRQQARRATARSMTSSETALA